jgi:hypothetical protein
VGLVPPVRRLLCASRPLTQAVATASAAPWAGLCPTVAVLYAGQGGGTDGPWLDVARRVVVSWAPLAAAGERGRTQEWWEAARGEGRPRRGAPPGPAWRASPRVQVPLGYPASPLVQAFLPLGRSTGEPAIFLRSVQVHGRTAGHRRDRL